MVDCIIREISIQKNYLGHEEINTIYFGGGTPSILSVNELQKILESIHRSFKINASKEFTLEANPDDLSHDKLKDLKDLDINRLSIGIQSFNNKTLKFLNRAHDAAEAISCFENARLAGFDNISLDLIFSIPGQSIAELEDDIGKVLGMNPEHISVYSLTIEEKTVFGNWNRKGKINTVNDENSARQFDLIISSLEDHQYEQYEISNFCRDRNYSRHNTSYWKNVKYLGLGPGAHSYDGQSRQFNIANNHKYMRSINEGNPFYEIEYLTKKEQLNERLLTSLRTKWGCDLNELNNTFQTDLLELHKEKIDRFKGQELIQIENDKLYLTRKGRFVADEIIGELFLL